MKATDRPSVILFENDQEAIEIEDSFLRLMEATAVSGLKLESMGRGCKMDITFVDDARIREINYEFRNIDVSTDVLSFPMVQMTEGKVLDDTGDYDPEDGLLLLGDIVVSLETAKRQALEYGHSFLRECAFLVSHGVFHLLGYDHEDGEGEARMFARQEEVLKNMGLTRE